MSNTDMVTAQELGQTWDKKYWRRTGKVEIKLDKLHDWISVLTTFV